MTAESTCGWTALNLEGDAQADLEVHGGPDKAVYAYPSEHLPAWAAELGEETWGRRRSARTCRTAGATEDDVCIGDRWFWGDAVLEVCQPRMPCFKLTMHRGRGDIGAAVAKSGSHAAGTYGCSSRGGCRWQDRSRWSSATRREPRCSPCTTPPGRATPAPR